MFRRLWSLLPLLLLLTACNYQGNLSAVACDDHDDCELGDCRDGFCVTDEFDPDAEHADVPEECDHEICGGLCVDTDFSDQHCGTCGNPCGSNESCLGGDCVADVECEGESNRACEPGGSCIDTLTSDDHCGSCNNPCGDNESCQNGECECIPGLLDCDGTCANPNDPATCGACDNACGPDQGCDGTDCTCPGSETACGLECADTEQDPDFCGDCITSCDPGEFCDDSTCSAVCNQTLCPDGSCVNTQTNRNHCGGCGQACPTGEICEDSACACTGGLVRCVAEGACIDTDTNDDFCGDCDNTCGADQSCSGGSCACDDGSLTLCDGSCVDTTSDPNFCGGCAATPCDGFCIDGSCQLCDPNAAAGEFGGGAGTAASPYRICSTAQLLLLTNDNDLMGNHFVLHDHITLTGTFPGIGNEENPFTGHFDGDTYDIIDLSTSRGFFHSISGTVQNLNFNDPQISGDGPVGVLTGRVNAGGVIQDIEILNATVSSSDDLTGGVAGGIAGSATNITVTGSVSGAGLVGGAFGTIVAGAEVVGVSTQATVTGAGEQVGGLAGRNEATIRRSEATGNVSNDNPFTGGLVGRNTATGEIRLSRATGNVVSDDNEVGGLVGRNDNHIYDSYARGNVTGSEYVGGLVGYFGRPSGNRFIEDCYATGTVLGDDNVGGLVGAREHGNAQIIDSYFNNDANATETADNGLGTGKTVTELQDPETFDSWEEANWTFDAGQFPRLHWED